MKSIPPLMLRFSFTACLCCILLLLLALLIGRVMLTDRLVFLSDRDGVSKLYALDIHRGVTHKLNDKELLSYTLSPDGRQILYMQPINDHSFSIFTMSLTGINVRQLIGSPATSPAWSPDSHFIAFSMYDEKHNSSQIYRMKSDGSDLQPLTQFFADETPFLPIWSPDGKRILFHVVVDRNRPGTFFMNTDGSALQEVTYPEDFEVLAASARWSPDNRYLAFAGRFSSNQNRKVKTSLCLLELASNEIHCPADDVFSGAAWSPDSKLIAYIASKGFGIFNLEILNIDTGETRPILRYDEVTAVQINNLGYLMWTPDGSALVYELSISGSRDDVTQLYIINADGSGERRLTDGVSVNYMASWWPDE